MNVDLEVRQLASTALGASIESLYSDSTLGEDADTQQFFWRSLEDKYDIVITRAQRQQLSTIGQIVHHLKLRLPPGGKR